MRSHSSSCPSIRIPFVILRVAPWIRAGVGSVSVRAPASTASASIRMAASLDWGFGPGYRYSSSGICRRSGSLSALAFS